MWAIRVECHFSNLRRGRFFERKRRSSPWAAPPKGKKARNYSLKIILLKTRSPFFPVRFHNPLIFFAGTARLHDYTLLLSHFLELTLFQIREATSMPKFYYYFINNWYPDKKSEKPLFCNSWKVYCSINQICYQFRGKSVRLYRNFFNTGNVYSTSRLSAGPESFILINLYNFYTVTEKKIYMSEFKFYGNQ